MLSIPKSMPWISWFGFIFFNTYNMILNFIYFILSKPIKSYDIKLYYCALCCDNILFSYSNHVLWECVWSWSRNYSACLLWIAIFSYPDARNCRLSTLFHHYHTKTTKKGFTSNSILVAVVFTPFFEMYFTYLFILQRFFLVHFKVVLGKKTRVVLIPQIKRDTILL